MASFVSFCQRYNITPDERVEQMRLLMHCILIEQGLRLELKDDVYTTFLPDNWRDVTHLWYAWTHIEHANQQRPKYTFRSYYTLRHSTIPEVKTIIFNLDKWEEKKKLIHSITIHRSFDKTYEELKMNVENNSFSFATMVTDITGKLHELKNTSDSYTMRLDYFSRSPGSSSSGTATESMSSEFKGTKFHFHRNSDNDDSVVVENTPSPVLFGDEDNKDDAAKNETVDCATETSAVKRTKLDEVSQSYKPSTI